MTQTSQFYRHLTDIQNKIHSLRDLYEKDFNFGTVYEFVVWVHHRHSRTDPLPLWIGQRDQPMHTGRLQCSAHVQLPTGASLLGEQQLYWPINHAGMGSPRVTLRQLFTFSIMSKLLSALAFSCVVSGCTTHVYQGPISGGGPTACARSHYDVTVDSWCGNGCANYPVSHRERDLRPENNRVELNGIQAAAACTYK